MSPRDPTDIAAYEDELAKVTVGGPQALLKPIETSEYDPGWPLWYADEERRLRSILGDRVIRIEHVGSTAVPGLPAKAVIGIVLELRDSAAEARYVPERAGCGGFSCGVGSSMRR
jgi:GrpB-like predicted nucleotidyltransferase (UPF0157 family)